MSNWELTPLFPLKREASNLREDGFTHNLSEGF